MEGGGDFDAFYRDSYARLVRQLWAVTGSRQDAEDVVQEAFVRAAARWGRVGAYELPEAWVRQVAIRQRAASRPAWAGGPAAAATSPAGRPVGGPASASLSR
jgi:DNA-directed RNA polymerase specialized sigma24 family protein